jgi:hypothetical protein
MAYAVSVAGAWRRTTADVGKTLIGAKSTDPSVEQGTKLDPVIHLRTAQAPGPDTPAAGSPPRGRGYPVNLGMPPARSMEAQPNVVPCWQDGYHLP